MQKCSTPYCLNNSKKKHCSKCYSRKARAKNPMLYAYLNLKHNAKRRGKYFDLTFEQFKEFCFREDYLAGKGKRKESYSVDRIDNSLGYTASNIRVLSLSDNAKKGTKSLNYDWQTQSAIVTNNRCKNQSDEDLPF